MPGGLHGRSVIGVGFLPRARGVGEGKPKATRLLFFSFSASKQAWQIVAQQGTIQGRSWPITARRPRLRGWVDVMASVGNGKTSYSSVM